MLSISRNLKFCSLVESLHVYTNSLHSFLGTIVIHRINMGFRDQEEIKGEDKTVEIAILLSLFPPPPPPPPPPQLPQFYSMSILEHRKNCHILDYQ